MISNQSNKHIILLSKYSEVHKKNVDWNVLLMINLTQLKSRTNFPHTSNNNTNILTL